MVTCSLFIVPAVGDTSLPLPAGDEGGGGGVDAVLHHAQVRRQLTTAVAGQTLAWDKIISDIFYLVRHSIYHLSCVQIVYKKNHNTVA